MSNCSRREFILFGLGATTLGALVSCGSTTAPTTARLTARPGTPTITPVQGAAPLGLESGRDGIIYVPNSYDPATPAPLFIALHGAGGSANSWTNWYARAEARRMVFLAPSSRGGTWDLMQKGQMGIDVSFIDRALTHTFARTRIDPTRICLGGFSDGATYALALGLANGDICPRIASYSPGYLALADTLVGKPRVFISHGTSDNILPASTSRDVIVPRLKSDGYDVTFREFAGVHEVPAPIAEESLDWFLGA